MSSVDHPSVVPVFTEVQADCLVRTVDYLHRFAIPSYDEEQLREWLRVAGNCRSILEVLLMQVTNVWLHATSGSGAAGGSGNGGALIDYRRDSALAI